LYPGLAEQARGVTDREEIRKIFAGAPVCSLLVVAFGWSLGSFAGGFVATWLGKRPPFRHALMLGVVITLMGVLNNIGLPPPLWFWCLSLLVPIPSACIGALLAPAKRDVAA